MKKKIVSVCGEQRMRETELRTTTNKKLHLHNKIFMNIIVKST